MLFTISVHHGPHYLIVAASGSADLADLCGGCNLAAEVGGRRGYRQVLIDLLGVEPDLDDAGRRDLGLHIATQMKGFRRVAVAMPPVYRSGIGESAARGAGLNLQLFANLDEATQWLQRTA